MLKDQEIKEITDKITKPMTTVIGIKCKDGIVIASDSQVTSEAIKDLQTSKIFPINPSIVVGAAGNMGHISVFVDDLKRRLSEYTFETETQLRNYIDESLVGLYRVYNLERSIRLGYAAANIIFNAVGLLGAKLTDGTFCLYSLITSQPWVYPIDNYQAIGSGYLLANMLLNQHNRVAKIQGKRFSDLELDYSVWIAIYCINEIKQIEPYTGGSTKVVYLDKQGLKEIPDDMVSKFYSGTINKISESLGTLPETKELAELLKLAYPPT
jgi:20S proteasome alpha/beta subunit